MWCLKWLRSFVLRPNCPLIYGASNVFGGLETVNRRYWLSHEKIKLYQRREFYLFCSRQIHNNTIHCQKHEPIVAKNEEASKKDADIVPEHWVPYLMNRMHTLEESSRFHGYSTLRWGVSILVCTLVVIYACRDQLRSNVADEVADVASRSMADENVMLKAHEMTKGVLERLTTEENTVVFVTKFLTAILEKEDVKQSAVMFVTDVLNQPEIQKKLQEVVITTLNSLLQDKDTKDLLLNFIESLIQDPQTRKTCNNFLHALIQNPEIQEMLSEFLKSILTSTSFLMEAVTLGRNVTHKVIDDEDIQKQTGEALWSAFKYGVTPSWFRGEK